MDSNNIPYFIGIMTTGLILLFIVLEVPFIFGASIVGMIFGIGIVVMLVLRLGTERQNQPSVKEIKNDE